MIPNAEIPNVMNFLLVMVNCINDNFLRVRIIFVIPESDFHS